MLTRAISAKERETNPKLTGTARAYVRLCSSTYEDACVYIEACEDRFVHGATQVPMEVLLSKDLRPLDTRIYSIMCSRHQDGAYMLSTKGLADELGPSVRLIQSAVKRLKDFGFIRRDYAKWKTKQGKCTELVHVLRLLPNGKINPKY